LRAIARLGFGAFNFHPGPPSYPGWVPSHFALYERSTEFGATVHVMVEQVPFELWYLRVIPDPSDRADDGKCSLHLNILFERISGSCSPLDDPNNLRHDSDRQKARLPVWGQTEKHSA
jgi:methionyl-tRNA formyltransferase